MFRTGLLVSTAMTACALLLSGAPAYAQTDMHVASHDPNTRFLCTYGFQVSSYSSNENSGSWSDYRWERVAVRVTGHGQTVSKIRVIEARAQNTSTSAFSVGIYSNNASGFPGNPIAVGSGSAGPACGPVKVSIPPTKLKLGKKYWIVETTANSKCYSSMRGSSHANRRKYGPSRCSAFAGLYWEADPNTKRKAYVQHHFAAFSSGNLISSSTSPWTKQTTGPYLKLR